MAYNNLTGDRYLEDLVDGAEVLVRAVHNEQAMPVDAILADAEAIYGDPVTAAHALVVLLAAMVPDDKTATELLAWRQNPHEYRRLRSLGVPASEAAVLAGQVVPMRKGEVA